MLGDRARTRRLLQTIRYAAKHGMVVRFETDREHSDAVCIDIKGTPDGPQVMTINSLALYKPRKKMKTADPTR